MSRSYDPDIPMSGEYLPLLGGSERFLVQTAARWLLSNFTQELESAVRGTPFSKALLCAIAYREGGIYWLPFTEKYAPEEVLGLCVFDASGDYPGTENERSAFPHNTDAFIEQFGNEFANILIAQANQSRAARGYKPQKWVYKGYGIFQYDLQFVFEDESFFRNKLWYDFSECTGRAIRELSNKYSKYRNIRDTVRAYNGSGPRAEQYAVDVMRILPYCAEVTKDGLNFSPSFSPELVTNHNNYSAAFLDPGAPSAEEEDEILDIDNARILANLGAIRFEESDLYPLNFAADGSAAIPQMQINIATLKDFLRSCQDSIPRVTYRLGAKINSRKAVPGRDFSAVDCSGFVREAILRSTASNITFPDGSVVQHDWIRAHNFKRQDQSSGAATDGRVRIAFLRPQDSPKKIGHVSLIHNGWTLESHGGVGPDSRRWTGRDWQERSYVYAIA